jgi:hypothetical protein
MTSVGCSLCGCGFTSLGLVSVTLLFLTNYEHSPAGGDSTFFLPYMAAGMTGLFA